MNDSPEPVAILSGIDKGYRLDTVDVPVLRNVDLLVLSLIHI